ncbi:hypothetical protein EHYA_09944 [Embleya hyalina]|uniref:Uncharacterized protein n=1 Tax=Embleya hyalina TaxID=516124 RepID=A0A401Z5P8_9ACTN|nr:hypothetical protein EHYA_09944 [Embleya hyalina]
MSGTPSAVRLSSGQWRARGHRLAAADPDHTTTHGSSWGLTARPVIIHPETVTLARALARTRLAATPRPDRHPAVTTFLGHTAHTLGLTRWPPDPTTFCGPGSTTTRDPENPAAPRAEPPDHPKRAAKRYRRLWHPQPNCTKSQRIPQHPRNPTEVRKPQLTTPPEPTRTPTRTPKPRPPTLRPEQPSRYNCETPAHTPRHPRTNDHSHQQPPGSQRNVAQRHPQARHPNNNPTRKSTGKPRRKTRPEKRVPSLPDTKADRQKGLGAARTTVTRRTDLETS